MDASFASARARAGTDRSAQPRRWRIPPALLGDPGSPDTLEGERILADYAGDAGLVLWQAYRDARLWADTPRGERDRLFHKDSAERWNERARAAGLAPAMLDAVESLAAALRRERGAAAAASSAALAISGAAADEGCVATSIAYAQLACALDPSAPAAALAAGRTAARFGRTAVAETWLRRALALGRRARDWGTYAGALVALGELHDAAGLRGEARTEYRRAVLISRRHQLRETRGAAFHALLRMALRDEDFGGAELLARNALRCYGRDNPAAAAVLLDSAELELRRGNHPSAARLMRSVSPAGRPLADQVRVALLQVRAEGGAGNADEMQEAWYRASGLAAALGETEEAGRLLLELARATAEVLEESHADLAAKRALACATRAGAAALASECTAFLSRRQIRAEA